MCRGPSPKRSHHILAIGWVLGFLHGTGIGIQFKFTTEKKASMTEGTVTHRDGSRFSGLLHASSRAWLLEGLSTNGRNRTLMLIGHIAMEVDSCQYHIYPTPTPQSAGEHALEAHHLCEQQEKG